MKLQILNVVINMSAGAIFVFAGLWMKEVTWVGIGFLLILATNIYIEVMSK